MTTQEMQSRMREIDNQQSRLERQARELGGGEFTDAARQQYDELTTEYKQLETKLTAILPRRASANSGAPIATIDNESATLTKALPRAKWTNLRTGETVRCFAPAERLATRSDLSVGRMLQALATGNWRHAEAERQVFAMSETDTGGGHFLVPDELSSMVIDLARAASVVFPWGAQTVDMTSDSLTIARQESDATFEVKAENESFSETEPTFGAIALHARTIGTVVSASRELAEDAPNFPTLVEDGLRRALGAEVDRLILVGNGGSESIEGIVLRSGIGSTGSVGGILWEDFHNAAVAIRALNHQPNGIVLHPTILGDAQILTSGDGTNSAKLWLGPPPSLSGVSMLPTTGISTAQAIVGDGSKIVVGFRTQARVERSTEAGSAFEKHQVKFKITLRFDFGLTQPAAFHLLDGITT